MSSPVTRRPLSDPGACQAQAEKMLSLAMAAGADAAEVLVRDGRELSVKVRLGEPELVKEAGSRGLGLRVGRCSAEFHTLGGGGSTPRPATFGLHQSMARYANWHRGRVENLVPVGSTPTRATDRNSSRRLAAKTPVLHTG